MARTTRNVWYDYRMITNRACRRILLISILTGTLLGLTGSALIVPAFVDSYYYREDGTLSTYPGASRFKIVMTDPTTGEQTLVDPPGQRSLTTGERWSNILEESMLFVLG